MYLGIKQGVKNLIKWFPIVWQDRDFDHGYLYEMLHFKLNNMEKFFSSGNTFSEDAEKYAEEIKQCKNLLERITSEAVFDEYWDGKTFTKSIDDIIELDKQEKHKFWRLMEEGIDGWWD